MQEFNIENLEARGGDLLIPNIVPIENHDELVYHSKTKIVYIMVAALDKTFSSTRSFGFLSPYISENGKFCKYEESSKKIVEI